MSEDRFDFIFFFAVNKVRWRLEEVRAVFRGFLIGGKERGVEDRVDFPLGGNTEAECRSRDDFSISNGPVLFICSFLGPFMWRLVVSNQTFSPTFHGVYLEVIHSFIFC